MKPHPRLAVMPSGEIPANRRLDNLLFGHHRGDLRCLELAGAYDDQPQSMHAHQIARLLLAEFQP